jgi:hypothetical protein
MRMGNISFFSHDKCAEAIAIVSDPSGCAGANRDQRTSNEVESFADREIAAVNLRSA